MADYNLKTILATFTKTNGKKRTIFNKAPIGGLGSPVVTLFFFSLPLIVYGLLFNPYIYHVLGIATAIVAYIVAMSFVMMMVFLIAWKVKNSVVKAIAPSWEKYFPGIDLNLVISSNISPYNDFYKYYSEVKDIKQSEESLHKSLLEAFSKMQEENKELLNAIQRDKK
jgi:predicted neutral ceramidase superfamily lipid hydrolase